MAIVLREATLFVLLEDPDDSGRYGEWPLERVLDERSLQQWWRQNRGCQVSESPRYPLG